MDTRSLSKRIEEIRSSLWVDQPEGGRSPKGGHGAVQSTISVLEAVYGRKSTQLSAFLDRIKKGVGQLDTADLRYQQRIARDLDTVLGAALADAEAGFVGSITVQAKGEILGDFVALARTALDARDADSDRVAAVLVAAALEETLKQLGEAAELDVYNRDMRGVIQKLKDGDALVGAQTGVATGFVKFRDHAFHGQFAEIERPTTEAALSFVEGLLISRFS